MAQNNKTGQLMESLSLPVGDLIAEVGKGVAQAQQALDAQVIDNFKNIYNNNDDALKHLREIGYRPTWYHIPQAEAQLQVSLTISGNYSESGTIQSRMHATPVDAGYKNNFDYSLEGSSTLKFKVVPIPEPTAMESRQVMPDLSSKSVADAKTILDALNTRYELLPAESDPDAKVLSTVPVAGEFIEPLTIVLINVQ